MIDSNSITAITKNMKNANTCILPFVYHTVSCPHCSCRCTFAETTNMHITYTVTDSTARTMVLTFT